MSVTLHEIETHWTLCDVYEAHAVLGAIREAENRARERSNRGAT